MVTLYSQEEVLRDYVTSEKFTSEVKGIVELSQELGRSFRRHSFLCCKKNATFPKTLRNGK